MEFTSTRKSQPSKAFLSLIRRGDVQLFGLLALAVLFGGGGVRYGFFNLTVQLAGIGVLAVNREALFQFARQAPYPLVLLIAATMALPLLQLLPLPPVIWMELPGRDLVLESLLLSGRGIPWFPISVDINRTLLAFVSLLPALAVLVLAWRLDSIQAVCVLWLIVGLGLLNLGMGALQLSTINANANFYPGAAPDQLYGTFANHNSAGIFLLISLLALVGLPSQKQDRSALSLWRLSIAVMLVVGVVLTQSRSSIALLAVPAAFAILQYFQGRKVRNSARWWGVAPVLALALIGVGWGGYALLTSPKVQQSIERFEGLEDGRPGVWEDSLVVAGRYWPVGSGFSTFDEVFQVDESLEHVLATRAGRAHNDYLEVAIEAGAAGLALVLVWILWMLTATWRAATQADALVRFTGSAMLLCVMAQSMIDYPLRNQALLCVAAAMVALLARRFEDVKQE